jgi:hypothetical protein
MKKIAFWTATIGLLLLVISFLTISILYIGGLITLSGPEQLLQLGAVTLVPSLIAGTGLFLATKNPQAGGLIESIMGIAGLVVASVWIIFCLMSPELAGALNFAIGIILVAAALLLVAGGQVLYRETPDVIA